MNTLRKNTIVRATAVLLLFVALIGVLAMPAAQAQSQIPTDKQLPAELEPGESAPAVAWNMSESEPNNTIETADPVAPGDVIRGTIDYAGDVDYFYVSGSIPYLLTDIDAQSMGSALDSVVCTYDYDNPHLDQGICNDDSDGFDSMVFTTIGYNGWTVIRVSDYGGQGGSSYNYNLIVSQPMLLSAFATKLGKANVAGIPFKAEDVLAWSPLNTGEEKWVMFFDGSDVGVTKNLHNIASDVYYSTHGGGILLGYAVNTSIPGLGTVTPHDVVRFGGNFGPNTSGEFSWAWRGADHQLSARSEKIDALGGWGMWSGIGTDYAEGYLVSTVGNAKLGNGLVLRDEDVGVLERWYDLQWGGWYQILDGSTVPGLGSTDVVGIAGDWGSIYNLVIAGNRKIAGNPVTPKDVVQVCIDPLCQSFWHGLWHGPDHGWNYNIDAIEYGWYGNW